jgi:hypothetical protein
VIEMKAQGVDALVVAQQSVDLSRHSHSSQTRQRLRFESESRSFTHRKR